MGKMEINAIGLHLASSYQQGEEPTQARRSHIPKLY